MTAFKGSLVLIKIGDGAPDENFSTIGGMRLSQLIVNNELAHSSNRNGGEWRLLLDGAGMKSVSLRGSGIFTDTESEEKVRQQALTNGRQNYQFIFGNGDCMTGPFCVSHYQRSGNHNAEEIYVLSLESAGAVEFTAH
jgi:predicted secreted protein